MDNYYTASCTGNVDSFSWTTTILLVVQVMLTPYRVLVYLNTTNCTGSVDTCPLTTIILVAVQVMLTTCLPWITKILLAFQVMMTPTYF